MADQSQPTRRTTVVVGDLAGDDRYHAGDEAMSLAAVQLLTRNDATGNTRIIATSSDPQATSDRLGCEAVAWTGFVSCADEAARRAMLDSVTNETLAYIGTSRDDGAEPTSTSTSTHISTQTRPRPNLPALLAAVAGADAVLIAGGGNLNSHWPEHIYERLAVARTAAAAGIPVVITGQTLGPRIDDHHRSLVLELLTTAELVGVREGHSHALALELGMDPSRLMLQADDALLLGGIDTPPLPEGFDPGTPTMPRRFIAVTFHPFATPDDPRMISLAEQLATAANRVGAQLLFVPHMRGAEGPGGTSDVDIAGHLAHITGGFAMSDPDAAGAAWAARNAWVVVSTRYHPLVFATGAAVPSLALVWDHYTAVKCRGALDHVELGNWWLHVDSAAAGCLEPALAEVIRRRVEISSWMHLHTARLRALDEHRQAAVAAALGLAPSPASVATGPTHDRSGPAGVASPGRTVPQPAGHWTTTQR